MKTVLFWLGVLYFIQILTIIFSVYFLNRKIETIEDLVKSIRRSHYLIWIPIIGMLLNILIIMYYIYEDLWYKIKKIRIR